MNIWSLAREYEATRVWVLESSTILQCLHEAVRFYAAYGDIRSLSRSDVSLPGAAGAFDFVHEPVGVPAPAPAPVPPPSPAPAPPAFSPASWPWPGESALSAPAPMPKPNAAGLPVKDIEHITDNTTLTPGEWAIIKPLFVLYVERENATHLEASRGLGVDVFGRSVAEVQNDIVQMEQEIPARAFVSPMIEI